MTWSGVRHWVKIAADGYVVPCSVEDKERIGWVRSLTPDMDAAVAVCVAEPANASPYWIFVPVRP